MTTGLTILTCGDSSACSFIAWRLAVGNATIITVGSNCTNKNRDSMIWKSEKYADHTFKSSKSYTQISHIPALESKLDLVLLCAESIEELTNTSKSLKPLIDEETILIVDSTHASSLEKIIMEYNPNNVVLSLFSEASVRQIEYDTQIINQHLGNKVSTMIGTSLREPPPHICDCLKGSNNAGKKLSEIIQNLQNNGVYPCTLLQTGVKPSINSFIWKRVLSYITFDLLSLIYGEINLKDMRFAIVQKIFNEIINLASVDCPNELPQKTDLAKCNQLFEQTLTQFNQLHSKYKIEPPTGTRAYSDDELFDVPSTIYNFSNKFQLQAQLSLEQCLYLSKEFKLEVPYLESINTFYFEIQRIQSKEIFDWVSKTTYVPPIPQTIPQAPQGNPIVNGYNSDTSLFNKGTNTPLTPLSNTIPPGYTFYPEQNVMLPNGITPQMLQYPPPQFPEMQQNSFPAFGAHSRKKAEHPRFKDLPNEEINGKKIHFKQVKNLVYPSTKGSSVPETLAQAQKHIYQYLNLNGTFEAINNRYGMADSLNVFKMSSGFKDNDGSADDESDKSINITRFNSEASKSIKTNTTQTTTEEPKPIETKTNDEENESSDDDVAMEDAEEGQ